MKKAESILLTLLGVGVLLKLIGIEGGYFAITLSSSILMLFYFPFGFLTLKGKPEDEVSPAFSFSAGLALSVSCLAVMFLIQNWPGATMYQWYGLFTPFAILVYSSVKTESKDFKSYYGSMKVRSGFLLLLVILSVVRYALTN